MNRPRSRLDAARLLLHSLIVGMPLWLRSTLMTVLFPGMIAGLIPYRLARGSWALPFGPSPVSVLGWPILLIGIVTLFLTILSFAWTGRGTLAPWDAPRNLVQGGLYRRVRNPMYLGVLATIGGQGLITASLGVLLYAVVMAVVFHVRVVRFEEPALQRLFGPTFEAYLREVPRWVPRLSDG